VIEGGGQIVAHEDPEIAAELQRALEAEGINFLLNTNTTAIERAGESVVLSLEVTSDLAGIKKTSSGAVTGSHLLIATGRTPNTDTLGLENAGIATDAHGFIKVNGSLETSVPGVWAMGDVKGGPAFTHISYNDYQIIYANLIEAKNFSIDHRIVPYAVYTDPELGRVGLTEKEARAQGYKLKIGSAPMTKVSRAIERDETAGLMKLVVDATNDQVLGAAILASEGGEVVHILYTLMLGKLPYTLLKGPGSMFIHPTLTEGLFFLMEAVKPVG
jgi:pyruvate/2-oxoglutarate dehydrogenase complex dihydrolipoamide dehydrogenase (E3) component